MAKTVCRHAVKARDPLAGPELEALVEDLRHCAMPYTCLMAINGRSATRRSRSTTRRATIARSWSTSPCVATRRSWAIAGTVTLPVAILSHGNSVKFTEYSFLANVFAARGYLAVSIQHDTSTDGPLVTIAGEPYAGRLHVYERGVANILFAIDRLKPIEASADYGHLTLVGHSNGGDISMYFAKLHPALVKKLVSLDSLRVPLATDGKFRILAFRSRDAAFKADPGVIPDPDFCRKSCIHDCADRIPPR